MGGRDQHKSPLNKEQKENKRLFGAVEKFGVCSSLTSGDCQPGSRLTAILRQSEMGFTWVGLVGRG